MNFEHLKILWGTWDVILEQQHRTSRANIIQEQLYQPKVIFAMEIVMEWIMLDPFYPHMEVS